MGGVAPLQGNTNNHLEVVVVLVSMGDMNHNICLRIHFLRSPMQTALGPIQPGGSYRQIDAQAADMRLRIILSFYGHYPSLPLSRIPLLSSFPPVSTLIKDQ